MALPLHSKHAALAFLALGVVGRGTVSPAPSPPSPAAPPPSPSSAALIPPASTPLDDAARAPATEVRLAPSKAGWLGAWLVAGPFASATSTLKKKPSGTIALTTPPEGVTHDANLSPRLAAAVCAGAKPIAWRLASDSDGSINLQSALGSTGRDAIAYAGGVLHVERTAKYYLLLGVDDGVRVSVDGHAVLTRDESRPARDDADLVPLDLAAGDHTVVLKLHQREGTWTFHARLVDETFAPPVGAYLALPGTTAAQARDLAGNMATVSFDRGMEPDGYAPRATVRFTQGAPRGVPLAVRARLVSAPNARRSPGEALFDVGAGEVPMDASGVGELVVTLPTLRGGAEGAARVEDDDWQLEATVVDHTLAPAPFHPRKVVREAIARAEHALAAIPSPPPAWLRPGSLESVQHLRDRLVTFVGQGDGDLEAEQTEARELDSVAASLEQHTDPYADRSGPMRRAYRSPADGQLSEFGLYVPPSLAHARATGAPERKYPLVVALHGMRGRPMSMLRYVFGMDDPNREGAWEDRHHPPYAVAEAVVVTPDAHGDAMYRDLGEDDVMRVVEWAMSNYPIDPNRVTITGPSMGGIGAAALAFHHPSVFAASAPLCGYHSYFLRRDVGGHRVRPWEQVIAQERSNVEWAENGKHIPLWIVHGKRDLPEANSGVLIERYEKLHYTIKHEHPDLGHNVWQTTYEDLKGLKWLMWHRRNEHPTEVRFRTVRPRFADDAWVHVEELAAPDTWGDVTAGVKSKTAIDVRTKGIAVLRLDRDEKLVDPHAPVAVSIDGTRVDFGADEPLLLHKDGTWRAGPANHPEPWKKGEITGPIRDVFHAPLLFVYGVDDPAEARVNEDVARTFARVGNGVRVKYPIVSDAEFLARGEPLANDRALFLVGNARSNRVVRALEKDFPIQIDGDSLVLGTRRIAGEQLGAAFIRPNPRRPDRYVVVVEGVNAVGTWRALSLPNLLPDFVVYDEKLAPSFGGMVIGAGTVRAGGFFRNDWSLPQAAGGDPSVAQGG